MLLIVQYLGSGMCPDLGSAVSSPFFLLMAHPAPPQLHPERTSPSSVPASLWGHTAPQNVFPILRLRCPLRRVDSCLFWSSHRYRALVGWGLSWLRGRLCWAGGQSGPMVLWGSPRALDNLVPLSQNVLEQEPTTAKDLPGTTEPVGETWRAATAGTRRVEPCLVGWEAPKETWWNR